MAREFITYFASPVTQPFNISQKSSSIFLCALVAFMAVWLLVTGNAFAQDTTVHNNLRQRGKSLRAPIDKKYKELYDANKLSDDIDVTSVVTEYIPIGTSFDDAKKILYGIGFQVSTPQ